MHGNTYSISNDIIMKVVHILQKMGDIQPGDKNTNIYEIALNRLIAQNYEYEHYQKLTKRVIEYQNSQIAELQNQLWKLRGETQTTENEVNRKEQVIQEKDKKATRLIEIIREKNRIINGDRNRETAGINGRWRQANPTRQINSRAECLREALGVLV